MKKIMALILSLVFIFAFSTVAFASGEEVVSGVPEYDFYDDAYTTGEGISEEEMLDDMLAETGLEMSTLIFCFLFFGACLLFVPALIVMIVFATKNKNVKEQIRNYEITYGVIYDKAVLKDMANIPPQNYNYNPQTFVPQYPVNNQPAAPQSNQDISAFSQALKNETNNENNGGNL